MFEFMGIPGQFVSTQFSYAADETYSQLTLSQTIKTLHSSQGPPSGGGGGGHWALTI